MEGQISDLIVGTEEDFRLLNVFLPIAINFISHKNQTYLGI